MAVADAAPHVLALLLLGVLYAGSCPGALASEHYTPLSLLKQELQHRQQQEAPAGGGCSPQSGDWGDQFSAECGGEWAAAGGRPGRRRAGGAMGAVCPGADVLVARASQTPLRRLLLCEPSLRGVTSGPLPAALTLAAARPPPVAASESTVIRERS